MPGEGHRADHFDCHNMAMQDNQGIRSSQFGFMKGRCCLTTLISFHDRVTHLEEEGKAVGMFYLGFSLIPSK